MKARKNFVVFLAGAVYFALIMYYSPAQAQQQQPYAVTVSDCRNVASMVRYAAVLRDAGYPRTKLEEEMKAAGGNEFQVYSNPRVIELAYVEGASLSPMSLYDIAFSTCMRYVVRVRRITPMPGSI